MWYWAEEERQNKKRIRRQSDGSFSPHKTKKNMQLENDYDTTRALCMLSEKEL